MLRELQQDTSHQAPLRGTPSKRERVEPRSGEHGDVSGETAKSSRGSPPGRHTALGNRTASQGQRISDESGTIQGGNGQQVKEMEQASERERSTEQDGDDEALHALAVRLRGRVSQPGGGAQTREASAGSHTSSTAELGRLLAREDDGRRRRELHRHVFDLRVSQATVVGWLVAALDT